MCSKNINLFIFSLFLSAHTFFAQTDTEFWFVAPEATSGHGDAPVTFRMAAFDAPAEVTISQPANPSFTPIISNIPANSAISVDMTAYLSLIENQPGDQVLNKGIKISSTALITAYYEIITSCQCNPEIFALKGKNALGTEFYTPFQTIWINGPYAPTPISAVDIVATQNNTIITITPTVDVTGHPAGIAYNITLNEGETYSMSAIGTAIENHPAGTHITSNKPIAVTIKDDSVTNGGCLDIMGDQLIPADLAGKEYIVMKGFLAASANENIFVLAISDNTSVYIDGSTTPIGTINQGQQLAYPITNTSTYVKTDKPAYVLHATGEGCELAEAVLPPIVCTGSQKVYFVRSVDGAFGVNVMTETENIDFFTLNGSNTLLPASAFTPVPGTNGTWMSTQLLFNTTDIPSGVFTVVENSNGLFHLGIINGGGGGCRYGYFSNFDQADPIDNEKFFCEGSDLILTPNDDYTSYLWSTGDTTENISVNEPGTYWLSVTSDVGCNAIDTIQIYQWDNPLIDLSYNDSTICGFNSLVNINAPIGFTQYEWYENGSLISQDQSLNVDLGTYQLIATDVNGCRWNSITPTQIDFEICQLIIPNIFTPNEDISTSITEGNNSFYIENLIYYPNSELRVFNRWGTLIYESLDYQNDWNPKEISEGTYYYILQVKYPDGNVQPFSGYVTIVR